MGNFTPKVKLQKGLCVCASSVGLRLSAAPRNVACQVPPSMEFSRQEYWSGLSFPTPRNLSDSGIEPMSPASAGGFFTASVNWEAPKRVFLGLNSS